MISCSKYINIFKYHEKFRARGGVCVCVCVCVRVRERERERERETSLVVWWSEFPATNHEVPGSIPGSTMGIFLVGGGSPW